MGWQITDIPDLSGRTFLVTGANSGLGFETAKALAGAGGQVVLAGRSREKIGAAQRQIPQDTLALELDLSDLASVHAAAESLPVASLDVLVNNAGVMAPPLGRTADGFETQIGTNHLGHFALTGLLLPRMPIDGGDARVVTVSSGAHRMGSVDVDDLNYERRKYSSWPAYGQSKLANLLFMAELDRRAHAADWTLRSVAAHPGYAATNLQFAGPKYARNPVGKQITRVMNAVMGQSASSGARPQLYAATMPDVRGGEYFGPDGLMESRGAPKRVDPNAAAKDVATAKKLWDLSEQLTGVSYDTVRPNSSTS
ncbi:MAG: SDR family oxidoreductase [Actinobacteria bacterium]|nr:SDR family oxidoreductase [Actinomycetota bacterium]MCB8997654.1 SDR family oxidoreductase [Actinomycetota bacterium]MCB9414524.1 SDR family oxidoreductase [Actinomycetota bacterium]MCB9423886.1 SDR family oxidoreductase [Actinomycetota bacterium]HRY09826.1 oxidoreductase [Candidatus Nanopelagicales bacterium]